jgi:hypothetical protein
MVTKCSAENDRGDGGLQPQGDPRADEALSDVGRVGDGHRAGALTLRLIPASAPTSKVPASLGLGGQQSGTRGAEQAGSGYREETGVGHPGSAARCCRNTGRRRPDPLVT